MKTREQFESTRTTCCWLGVAGGILANIFMAFSPGFGYMLLFGALILDVVGCYNWAKAKARSPWFCLWGVLAPIGFLGVALLSDRSWDEVPQTSANRITAGMR